MPPLPTTRDSGQARTYTITLCEEVGAHEDPEIKTFSLIVWQVPQVL